MSSSDEEIRNDHYGFLSLRSRLYLALWGIFFLVTTGSGIMVWYIQKLQVLVNDDIPRSITAFQSAEALETALINQKGFVTYYLQDRDPEWLHRLGEYRQIFREKLTEAEKHASTLPQKELIREIRVNYERYILAKDEVIAHYVHGRVAEGQARHPEIRVLFFRIMQHCEDFKALHSRSMTALQEDVGRETSQVRHVTLFILMVTTALIFTLGMRISRQILVPLRRLAREAGAASCKAGNEVAVLSRGVEGLIRNAGEVSRELERSRENLEQAERMVMVARLAAGMAHSIRNPLTSVKMRLFSLSRSLNLDADQKDDFAVISGEIDHIDTIVQNFLEFSRPPKLKIQSVSPSDVVDRTLDLLRHRLESYGVTVRLKREKPLPPISGDPEQLKEVLVNLMENSCQAMAGTPGHIEILEIMEKDGAGCPVACLCLHDSGPGIPADMVARIFEPFVTTKEEGTGLGLSIASRIVANHGGTLAVVSQPGRGACFTMRIPLISQGQEGEGDGPHPHH
ncbi:ATP-binding protein [Desulfobotulus sp. H1]|uniref:histidine kinase n=1 Tax=Desulfobotulus pelophilus TaxID=2823377 RepID=A0ABT3N944_9BACT|nr:ATP-binding protein [Desulfobotulus pelophilus]MCW7753986.1 ATP-binding protein [Desulfobotulus pelophilus]